MALSIDVRGTNVLANLNFSQQLDLTTRDAINISSPNVCLSIAATRSASIASAQRLQPPSSSTHRQRTARHHQHDRGAKTSQPCCHRNQQYSIVGLTNAAGTLVERYTYTAYGTLGIYAADGTVRSSSSYSNRYTYTGREFDPELKLYHFRARWYDPATGGFISRDPLGYIDGMSLYRGYFGVKGTDPSGEMTNAGDDSPITSTLMCPQPCNSLENCSFELDVFRAKRPFRSQIRPKIKTADGGLEDRPLDHTEMKEFLIISMTYTPKVPETRDELFIADTKELLTCYGGFNRALDGYIEWPTRGVEMCRLTSEGFLSGPFAKPDFGLHQLCAGAIKYIGPAYGFDRDGKPRQVGGIEIWLDIPGFFSPGPVRANFSIQTECFCDSGHVDLPEVPHHPLPRRKTSGTISIDRTL